MADKHEIDDETINSAIDIVEFKESMMTERDLQLKDRVNKELAKSGYGVRIALLQVLAGDEFVFDFVQPVDKWFEELQRADEFIHLLIRQLLQENEFK